MNRVRLNATGLKLCEISRGSSNTVSANDLGIPYNGNQFLSYHLLGLDVEGKRTFTSQDIKEDKAWWLSVRHGNQFLFYLLPGLDVEGKRTFMSQNIKEDKVWWLRQNALIRDRSLWVQKMSNAISANRYQTIVGELNIWPTWRPLDYVPSTYEVAVIIRALSTPMAVGADDLPA